MGCGGDGVAVGPADRDDAESGGAPRVAVEHVATVDDDPSGGARGDVDGIEVAELAPLGAERDDDRVDEGGVERVGDAQVGRTPGGGRGGLGVVGDDVVARGEAERGGRTNVTTSSADSRNVAASIQIARIESEPPLFNPDK